MSPQFLHLTEDSAHDEAPVGAGGWTTFELASRLSYFLTQTMPDDALN